MTPETPPLKQDEWKEPLLSWTALCVEGLRVEVEFRTKRAIMDQKISQNKRGTKLPDYILDKIIQSHFTPTAQPHVYV